MKNFLFKASTRLAVTASLLVPSTAFAQGLEGARRELAEVGGAITAGGGPATRTLPELIGNLINAFLGVLGIIFVIIIVYAGYLYLTAGGEEEKVTKAKKLLAQSIIGLIIILSAYAIASFIICQLLIATQ